MTFDLEYKKLTIEDINSIAQICINYYNNIENGCWTKEKACKRISQLITISDSMCLGMYKEGLLIGFTLGYYKQFDDLLAYFLDEIVIDTKHQNKGYGTSLIKAMEDIVKINGVTLIELSSVNDKAHIHFYKKSGFYITDNFIPMGKFLKETNI